MPGPAATDVDAPEASDRAEADLAVPNPPRAAPPRDGIFRTPEALTSAASGLLLALGWATTRLGAPSWVGTLCSVLAIVSGGYFFGRRALAELVEDRRIGTYFLMSLAALAALATGHPDEGAVLVFLTSISEAAQDYTERKTRGSITALMRLAPRVALVERDGRAEEVPADDLRVGDVFHVRPGEAIATDGSILSGRSGVDQAPVTGESVPVPKGPGDEVFAGTINGASALAVRATRTAADNTLARIIAMVEEAREHKGRSQRFIERFGAIYSPAVLVVAGLVAALPPMLRGQPWGVWLGRATVFLVASAPCAMVISIPVALVAAIGTAARQGVLIKGGVHLEALAGVRVVALDKTGTLTTGRPEVTDVVPLRHDAADPLALAASIEARSEHPLAAAIVRHARRLGVAPAEVADFRALPGLGASARLAAGGRALHAGSPRFFEERGRPPDRVAVERLQSEGKTVVVVGDDDGPIGLIALRDGLRPDARDAVRALKSEGIARVVMLTGDNPGTAEVIAAQAGVDAFHAGLRPEDKVARVRDMAARLGPVAMVGDGVNDAPALAEAAVGIAMGAAGTDVALETADVALMGDDLRKLALAFRLARRNRRIVAQNLAMATLLIASLALAAVAGLIALPLAVVGHELSEFLVIGNGLRMLRGDGER
jgi:Cd2+/Zn2+-exporting ATPase